MSGKSKQTTTTRQRTTQTGQQRGGGWSQRGPWEEVLPGLKSGIGTLTDWMGSPSAMQTYGGPRVADLSGKTQRGLSSLFRNDGYGASEDYYKNVLDGDYLNEGNPYVGQVQQAVMDSVMPGINATFARSGMTGSTVHQNQLATGLSNGMAQPLFANYENERNRQMSAAGALPGMMRQRGLDQIMAGSVTDQHRQNILNARMAAFNEARDRPMAVIQSGLPMLLQAGGMFGRNSNESWGQNSGRSNTNGTSQTTSSPSPFSQILGGGMMGLGMMSGIPGLGMSGMFGGGSPSYAPMTAASAGMMNSYNPSNNPFSSGGYPPQNPGFVPQYGPTF